MSDVPVVPEVKEEPQSVKGGERPNEETHRPKESRQETSDEEGSDEGEAKSREVISKESDTEKARPNTATQW